MPGPWQSAGQRGGLLGRARRLQRQLDHWTSKVN